MPVDATSKVLGWWGGNLLPFLLGRLTLVMLHRKSWVGVEWGFVTALDTTSYVGDVTSKVLGWDGVGIC